MKYDNLRISNSVREWQPKNLDVVAGIFVGTLLISNFAAQKLFQFGPFIFTAGIIVFPVSYIFGDVLTEVYGFTRTRRIIYLGLILNLFMSLIIWITIKLPPATGWNFQDEYAALNAIVPRIVLGSVIAYLAGELVNSMILSKMKLLLHGKHLWIRTIGSTIVGQLVDSSLFILIAFGGNLKSPFLITAILSAWLFKTFYEVLITPFTYIIVNWLKRSEGVDHYDKIDKYTLIS